MAHVDCLIRNVSWEDRSCDLFIGEGRVLELAEAGTVAEIGRASCRERV